MQPLPPSSPAELQKLEATIVRHQQILATTPPDQKRRLSEARAAIRDLEYRRACHLQIMARSAEFQFRKKEDELAKTRADLALLENASPTKLELGKARTSVWDLETIVWELQRRNVRARPAPVKN